MRILHLLKSNKYSGAENVVLTIMDVCSDMDMVYASPDGSIREVVESRGHEFYPLNRPTIREVKKAIRELHPDVIHAHDFTMQVRQHGRPETFRWLHTCTTIHPAKKNLPAISCFCIRPVKNPAGYQRFKSG